MTTFNLALLFNQGEAVSIIVCHNENGVNENDVLVCASEGIAECADMKCSPNEFASAVCKRINERCDCQAVVVNAHAATHIVSASNPN